jgi:hypothetical protein
MLPLDFTLLLDATELLDRFVPEEFTLSREELDKSPFLLSEEAPSLGATLEELPFSLSGEFSSPSSSPLPSALVLLDDFVELGFVWS